VSARVVCFAIAALWTTSSFAYWSGEEFVHIGQWDADHRVEAPDLRRCLGYLGEPAISKAMRTSAPVSRRVAEVVLDGTIETTAWTAAQSPVAFLALDRNHDGAIGNGFELFGNHTRGAGGAIAANGFEALATFDVNHDGVIDAADPIWSSLLLWTDADHDGRSAPAELQPITGTAISGINLDYRSVGRRDHHGNVFRYAGSIRLQHAGFRPIYDVFLRVE
jgi:hypothetical protein